MASRIYASRYTVGREGERLPLVGQMASADGWAWGSIDLRPDPRSADGWALVATNADIDAPTSEIQLLGDDVDAASPTANRWLANRLNASAIRDETTLRNAVRRLLLFEGRSDGTRWRPLRPSLVTRSDGRPSPRREYRIHLLDMVDRIPVIKGGATASDDFNRADSTNLGSDWTEVVGNIHIVGNQIAPASTGTDYAMRWTSDLASDDHYCQIDAVAYPHEFSHVSPACRFDPAAVTYYRAVQRSTAGAATDDRTIQKCVSGSVSALAAQSQEVDPPFSIRLTVDGSSLDMAIDGTTVMSVTDTSITGYKRPGVILRALSTGERGDNFIAADVRPVRPTVGHISLG